MAPFAPKVFADLRMIWDGVNVVEANPRPLINAHYGFGSLDGVSRCVSSFSCFYEGVAQSKFGQKQHYATSESREKQTDRAPSENSGPSRDEGIRGHPLGVASLMFARTGLRLLYFARRFRTIIVAVLLVNLGLPIYGNGIRILDASSGRAITLIPSSLHSAFLNRRSENVVIKAVIIAELELGDIEGKVLFADIVEGAYDAALEDRPKALNRLNVNRTNDVLMFGMVNGAMVEFFAKVVIADPLIRARPGNRS
jgi:hypothetical protein